MSRRKITFNPTQVQYIKDNYEKLSCKEIGLELNVSAGFISDKIKEMGLINPRQNMGKHKGPVEIDLNGWFNYNDYCRIYAY